MKQTSLFFVVLIGFLVVSPCRSEDLSLEQLNAMELRADEARKLYWQGDYEGAATIFKELGSSTHPSTALYFNELGMCCLAAGQLDEAKRCFLDVCRLNDSYTDAAREQRAQSSFGKEEEKIYKGDPYEQATDYLLLALLLLNDGDYDNALAACKSGIMADSDASENLYESDYTLLHLIEAKCHQLRGADDAAQKSLESATASYRITSPAVRALFSERLDVLAQTKLSRSDRKKIGIYESDDELQKKLVEREEALSAASQSINPEQGLGAFLAAEYNTLILVPAGCSPTKSRKGKDAQMVFFDPNPVNTEAPVILINDREVTNQAPDNVADIEFQATTRGGRRMDAILNGKAAYRSTTLGVGSTLTEIGNNVGGLAGLGVALVGAAVQGVAGAMTPEADTRCWETLPACFVVYAVHAPPGEHKVEIKRRAYFESLDERCHTVVIDENRKAAVLFAPPCLAGLYSETSGDIKLAARDTDCVGAENNLIVTPPMGLRRLEKFDSIDQEKGDEAFAPDLKKIMRSTKSSLEKANVTACLATHNDILHQRETLTAEHPTAFQFVVRNLAVSGKGKNKTYQVSVVCSLVSTRTGKALSRQTVEGQSVDSTGGATKAFYDCLDDALGKVIADEDFLAAMHTPPG